MNTIAALFPGVMRTGTILQALIARGSPKEYRSHQPGTCPESDHGTFVAGRRLTASLPPFLDLRDGRGRLDLPETRYALPIQLSAWCASLPRRPQLRPSRSPAHPSAMNASHTPCCALGRISSTSNGLTRYSRTVGEAAVSRLAYPRL